MSIPPTDPTQPSELEYASPAPQPMTFGTVLAATTPRVYFIWLIIAANVGIFLAMGLTGVGWFTPSIAGMEKWGADSWPLTTSGQWWRLFASAFLHFGFLHLAFNMWALWQVGELTERLFGNVVFAVIYVLTALLSGLASTWWDKMAVSAGASGAIFGVYGALLAYMLFQRRSFPPAAFKSLTTSTLVFIGYNVFYGAATPGISNAAHLGGLASGFFLGAIAARPLMPEARARQALPRLAALLILGVAAVGVGVAAIPRFPGSTEAKFLTLEKRFANEETLAVDAFNTLIKKRSAQEMTNAQLADAIDHDVVTRWDGLVKEAAAFDPGSDKRLQARRHNILLYCQARQQGFALIAGGNRTGNLKLIDRGEKIINDALQQYQAAENPGAEAPKP
jgi:rhomboid protease GluP